MRCPRCGRDNPSTVKACLYCATPLRYVAPHVHSEHCHCHDHKKPVTSKRRRSDNVIVGFIIGLTALLLAILIAILAFTGVFTPKRHSYVGDGSVPVTNDSPNISNNEYSISGITAERNPLKIAVETSAATEAIVKVDVYNQDSQQLVGSGSGTIQPGFNSTVIDVTLTETLDEFFVITAYMQNEDGRELCDSFTTFHYTREYAEFMKKTVDDFAGKKVVNFDNDKTNNFGVLVDNAMIIPGGNDFNILVEEETDIMNGTYVLDNPSDELKNVVPGQVIYLDLYQDMVFYVEDFRLYENRVHIKAADDKDVSTFFNYIKVDMEIDPDKYDTYEFEPYTGVVDENTDNVSSDNHLAMCASDNDLTSANVDLAITALKFSFPVELILKNSEGTQSGSLKSKVDISFTPRIKIAYDIDFKFEWFNVNVEHYFEMSLSFETKTSAEVTLKYGNKSDFDAKEVVESRLREALKDKFNLPGLKVPIPFGVGGLGAELEIEVAFELEFKASAEVKATSTSVNGFSYDTKNGLRSIKDSDTTKELKLGGSVNVKIGPSIKESITWCGGVLKASLVQEAGVKLGAEGYWTPENHTTEDTKHMCEVCIEGSIGVYFELDCELKLTLIKNILEEKITQNLVKFEKELSAFHVSSITGFGWLECKNKGYKLTVNAVDEQGQAVNASLAIRKKKSDGTFTDIKTGTTKIYDHLMKGNYQVHGEFNGITRTKDVTMDEAVQTVTLTFAEDPGSIVGVVAEAADRSVMIPGVSINILSQSGDSVTTLTTGSDGKYTTELPAGKYTIVVSKENYKTFRHQNVEVRANETINIETLLMVEDTDEFVDVAGYIMNSVTGVKVVGAKVRIRKDWNSESGEIIANTTTDDSGNYYLGGIPTGNYTVCLSREGFNDTSFNVTAVAGPENRWNGSMVPIGTEEIPEGDIRIVLRWGNNPDDLDSHLTGPTGNGTQRFHIFFPDSNKSYYRNGERQAYLDLDDINGEGPETTTVYVKNTNGNYKYSVHDFSNMDSSSSKALSNSGATVTVIIGGVEVRKFYVPANTGGTLWEVFEYNAETNEIIPINRMSYKNDPGSIT